MDSTVTPANKIQQKTLSNADDALEVYKKLVNFCECNQLKDYFTETPLLCYVNREEFLKACNYTNIQPLWAKDNLKKGAKNV